MYVPTTKRVDVEEAAMLMLYPNWHDEPDEQKDEGRVYTTGVSCVCE